jgi:hypothetical protein
MSKEEKKIKNEIKKAMQDQSKATKENIAKEIYNVLGYYTL